MVDDQPIGLKVIGRVGPDGVVSMTLTLPDGTAAGKATARLNGETIEGEFNARDPDGEPVAGKFTLNRGG
jgi:hypothetical protein